MQRKGSQAIVFFVLVVSLACSNPLQIHLLPRPGAVSAPVNITAIAAGISHTCALTSGGRVKCWGRNTFGELGDGTTNDSYTPVDVVELADATAIAAGGTRTCALASGGRVKIWGAQGGSTPVDISGLTSDVTAIAMGFSHTCVLTSGGGVKCWGGNGVGELGDGTFVYHNEIVDGGGLTSGVRAITVGYAHTCAITDSGGVKCWGWNEYGQLGDGTTTSRNRPVDVSGLTGDIQTVVAGYEHTCALTSSGGVRCWGENNYGQLGDGTTDNSNTPVDVIGLSSGVSALALGNFHTCALTSSGGVKCWGGGRPATLGNGSEGWSLTPVDVSGLTGGVIAITATWDHTCALTSSGGVRCWGDNSYGQLGDGTTNRSNIPVDVIGLAGEPSP